MADTGESMQPLTQGERLSMRQTRDGGGRSINNLAARTFDRKLKDFIPYVVIPMLQERYPHIEWTHTYKINQADYARQINPDYIPESNNPFISPDGGIVLANGKPVLITEAKKQGTNNERALRGLPRQSCGNAIERACKNHNELKSYMFDKNYFPYLLFAYGSDFELNSSIRSRLHSMTMYKPYNQFHIINDGNHQRASVFIQPDPFSDQFIIDTCIEATEIVLQHLNLV
jgi:type II restriction enzyme